ncbi:MAG: hypothetical protein KDA60_03235 [Planctomycetales bacterium]|nr:hypothetical protein [Planctomycetales bacterium]
MATEYDTVRYAPDWWSRWMALGSLCIAAATLAWSYTRNTADLSPDEMMAAVHAKTAEFSQQEEKALAARNTQAQQLLTSVRSETDALIDKNQHLQRELAAMAADLELDRQIVRRKEQAADQVAKNGAAPDNSETDNSETDNSETDASETVPGDIAARELLAGQGAASDADRGAGQVGDDSDDDAILFGPDTGTAVAATEPPQPTDQEPTEAASTSETDTRVAAAEPLLQIVTQASRPDSTQPQDRVPMVRVASRGDVAAAVEFVAFRPAGVIEVPELTTVEKLAESETDAWFIQFDKEDNRTKTAKHHGIYAKAIDPAWYILPQDERDIRLIIQDEKHAGYGLQGELTLRYGDGKQLVVPDAQVMFVAPAKSATAEQTSSD